VDPAVWVGPTVVGVLVGSLIAGARRGETPRQLAITASLALIGGLTAVALILLFGRLLSN